MNRREVSLPASGIGSAGTVLAFGHLGRPVLMFPSEAGAARDPESHGLIDAVGPLIDAGRVKVYCVDSFDDLSWSDRSLPLEERARRHDAYEAWIRDQVLPWIDDDCGGWQEVLTTGPSLGAYHAVNLALRHPDRHPVAIGMSGNYDPTTWRSWGEQGFSAFVHNPTQYVPQLDDGRVAHLRERVRVVLTVGEGPFEVSPTGALPSTRELAGLLKARGIPCDLDVWGPDTPHDWPSWQRQLALHLPRFC